MTYHITGAIAALAFLLTALGEVLQLRKVWSRRRKYLAGHLPGELPTAILSINQVFSVFLACFAFYLYALSLTPVNLYLGLPRLLAAILAIMLLREFVRDQFSKALIAAYYVTITLIAGAPLVLFVNPWADAGASAAKGLVVAATFLLAQGYIHQIMLIRRTGRTGAVSLGFHQSVLASGLTTIVFGLVMGGDEGWPLVLLASVSASLKITTLWHFRWVRLSPLAAIRRSGFSGEAS